MEKVERGCEEDSPLPDTWQVDDWTFQRCPLKLITLESIEYLKAYQLFDKGYLPNAGGWVEQPAKFLDAMVIISAEIQKVKDEEAEKQKKGIEARRR